MRNINNSSVHPKKNVVENNIPPIEENKLLVNRLKSKKSIDTAQNDINKNKISTVLSLIPKIWPVKSKKLNDTQASVEKSEKSKPKDKIKSSNFPINWVKGETINPYKAVEKVQNKNLEPPIVKFTKLSIESGDKTYALSRFRERATYKNVRVYLAFFYEKKDVCINGVTSTSLKVIIDQEGLPTERDELEGLYLEYHDKIGVSREEVLNDLQLCKSQMQNEYRDYLTKVRENWKKYMTP